MRECLNKGIVKPTKERGGGDKKVNDKVLKCLLCTIFDFPDATDSERAYYLNNYGPCQKKKTK